MVTVFGILNLTEDSFFDESRRLDPAGAVTAAIEMLRVGSDVVDVGPAASHPDARPVSPADEIRRHCCKVSDEAAFCLIQRPYISKTLLT
ncbi:dihydropteroate synthase, partial [Salmonella enterica subsp. enterica serovar Weltevreden]